MPNKEQKKKRRNILSRVIRSTVDFTSDLLSFPSRNLSNIRGTQARDSAALNFTKQIPSNLPEPVKKTARDRINEMAAKGNFAGIRKYLKGLSD